MCDRLMSQEVISSQELTLKEKLLNIAGALRNNQGVKQCTKYLIKEDDSMCAFGLLGFRAGIPKNELRDIGISSVLKRYGISYDEAASIRLPSGKDGRHRSLSMMWLYNDAAKMSFNEIADLVEEKANSL